MQTSLIARYSSLDFTPDPQLGDLLFNGIAQNAYKSDVADGLQSDGAYQLNDAHTLRGGVYRADRPLDQRHDLAGAADRLPTATADHATCRVTIVDNGARPQWIESVYLQDEWKLDCRRSRSTTACASTTSTPSAARSQLSPRVNLVWQAAGRHHRARRLLRAIFSPPPFELVGSETIAKFVNTTAAPEVRRRHRQRRARQLLRRRRAAEARPASSRSGVDSYYKQAHGPDRRGPVRRADHPDAVQLRGRAGRTASSSPPTTAAGRFSAYANLAIAARHGQGHRLQPVQLRSPDDLAYIADHYIHLDHEQQLTGLGAAPPTSGEARASAPTCSSARGCAGPTLPDGSTSPTATTCRATSRSTSASATTSTGTGAAGLTARFDVINVFDEKLRDPRRHRRRRRCAAVRAAARLLRRR